jgi:hypothetical protein
MFAFRFSMRAWLALLILTLTGLSNAFAFPVTWTLSGVTFGDGGTASGYFVYDADTNNFSEGSISVAGGNTAIFVPVTYGDPWNQLTVNAQNGFYSWGPGFGVYLWIDTAGLSDSGGTVALSTQSYECTNCLSVRYVSAGNVVGTPTPNFTSTDATTFAVGVPGSFTVIAAEATSVSITGSLPSGVTFTDNGDGTATLAGTPAAGSIGTYALTLTASNGVPPDATQNFTLTVDQAPVITSANAATFTVGAAGSFTVTTTGSPVAGLSEVGTLPSGVTFVDNGDGTATLSGTPVAGSAGTYALTLTASNGVSPDATQAFTMTVNAPPAVTPTPTLTWKGDGILLLLMLLAAFSNERWTRFVR